MKREINELVRNNIPEILQNAGKDVIYVEIAKEDFENDLILKMQAELGEYLMHKKEKNLVDMYEIFLELIKMRNFNIEHIEQLREDYNNKYGDYSGRKYILKIEK